MQDRDVAPPGGGVAELADVPAQRLVDRHGEDLGGMALTAEKGPDATGVVPDRVTLMRRREPLVDDHVTKETASCFLLSPSVPRMPW